MTKDAINPLKRVSAQQVTKTFFLRKESRPILKTALSFFTHQHSVRLTAVDDVSLTVHAGEVVGIVGRNGSGKSTLLKIIAGLYQEDSGVVTTDGSVIYLNGFSQGTHPDLTVKENIYFVASIMGVGSDEIKGRFDEIIAFSELQEFIDVVVSKLSTGMLARLNFSIALHCMRQKNPDILLLDEVFSAGGDIDFQSRSIMAMEALLRGGAAVLLVSHSSGLLEKYCDQILWLEGGKIKQAGSPSDVIEAYKQFMLERKK